MQGFRPLRNNNKELRQDQDVRPHHERKTDIITFRAARQIGLSVCVGSPSAPGACGVSHAGATLAAAMVYDFQTQSFLSDGVLSPLELIRRARHNGYEAIAITDHVGLGGLVPLLDRLAEDCRIAREEWGILAIPGVELTHIPPNRIAEAASRARDAGAGLVLVHGETPVEPVLPGTNRAAASCPEVDVLGHPGLLSDEDAMLAAGNDVYLEISTRRGHSLANGHIALVAQRNGAKLLVNSDAHAPEDLLTEELAITAALGAGLSREDAGIATKDNPRALLEILMSRLNQAPR